MGCALPVAVAMLALAAAPSHLVPSPDEIERVVAVVRSPAQPEPHVITLTRLQEETRIALVSRGAVLAATEPLDAAALHAGLEWVIDQMLLLDEANRLQVFDGDRGEVAAELERFKGRFARPADYEAFLARSELTEGELRAALGRALRVRRYVESRVARAGRDPERISAQVRSLARDLRARAEVRMLADLGQPGRPPSEAR